METQHGFRKLYEIKKKSREIKIQKKVDIKKEGGGG